MTLVGVLAHDRPEGLKACLQGLARAGADHRVVIHLDDADLESRATAYASGYDVIGTEVPIGIGASLNRILAMREPGETFVRVDGDTEVVTEGWLHLLLEAMERRKPNAPTWGLVSTVLRMFEGDWSRGVEPSDRVIAVRMGRGIGSVMAIRGDVVDALGGFREGFPFAFEDTDYHARLRQAFHMKVRAATDLRVVAWEAAAPSRKLWRFGGRTTADPVFRAARDAFFAEDHPTFRPIATSVGEIPLPM